MLPEVSVTIGTVHYYIKVSGQYGNQKKAEGYKNMKIQTFVMKRYGIYESIYIIYEKTDIFTSAKKVIFLKMCTMRHYPKKLLFPGKVMLCSWNIKYFVIKTILPFYQV